MTILQFPDPGARVAPTIRMAPIVSDPGPRFLESVRVAHSIAGLSPGQLREALAELDGSAQAELLDVFAEAARYGEGAAAYVGAAINRLRKAAEADSRIDRG